MLYSLAQNCVAVYGPASPTLDVTERLNQAIAAMRLALQASNRLQAPAPVQLVLHVLTRQLQPLGSIHWTAKWYRTAATHHVALLLYIH